MSGKITKSPQIRFTGFTDAWEQRAFSDLVIRVSKSSNEDVLPRVEYEDIVSGQGELNKDIFAKESDKKGIEFKAGDTLFGKLRPYLQNWLLADFKGIAVGDWWVLRPNEMDSKFIYSLVQSNKYQIVANLSTGTKMPRSDWKVVSETEFAVPIDKYEQEKIGGVFEHLDHLITLHQRKVELLEDTKKSLLQKMFPKDGANVPEIRFEGFTDAWEQRKLIEVADYRNGKAHEQDINEDGDYIVVNSKFVSTNGRVKKFSNALIEPLKTGEIAFVLSDVPNGKAIARTFLVNENNKYSLNQRIAGITPHNDTDPYFLSVLMNRNYYFLKFDNGVGQTNLSKSEVENFPERYPSYDEQRKIGTFFKDLGILITLHQRELNSLENLKKSLLQQMFV